MHAHIFTDIQYKLLSMRIYSSTINNYWTHTQFHWQSQ